MKILIIDSLHDQMHEFKDALTKGGFDVHVTNTGVEGMQEAVNIQPDLILLGEMLPHMTGNDVLKQLKLSEATKKIPVVILSHFKDDKLVTEAMALGAADYLVKNTLSAPDLLEKIQTVLKDQHGGTGWQQGDANEL